ncbi:MAG: hypothetical protein RLZZ488_1389 [Pseudomonadota bacterium]
MTDSLKLADSNPQQPCPMWLVRGFFILMGLSVALGAFGAHALRDSRTPVQLETWKTATLYLMVHALAGVVLSIYARHAHSCGKTNGGAHLGVHIPLLPLKLFFVGCLVFSGSLYALVLTQISLLGAITPFGGLMFIAGWIALAFGAKSSAQ